MFSRFGNALAAFAACTAVALCATAQEIKISHQFKANTDGRDKATRLFVEEVGKRDKALKFRIYPGSSLNNRRYRPDWRVASIALNRRSSASDSAISRVSGW